MELYQTKNLLHSNKTTYKIKTQFTEWEKIYSNNLCSQRLISKIFIPLYLDAINPLSCITFANILFLPCFLLSGSCLSGNRHSHFTKSTIHLLNHDEQVIFKNILPNPWSRGIILNYYHFFFPFLFLGLLLIYLILTFTYGYRWDSNFIYFPNRSDKPTSLI